MDGPNNKLVEESPGMLLLSYLWISSRRLGAGSQLDMPKDGVFALVVGDSTSSILFPQISNTVDDFLIEILHYNCTTGASWSS